MPAPGADLEGLSENVKDFIERQMDILSNGSLEEQQEAGEVLSELAKEGGYYFQEMGAVQLLVDRLSSPDITTRGLMMTLLFHLAKEDPTVMTAEENSENISKLIHNMMKHGPGPKGYESATKLLINLSNVDGLKNSLGSSGAISALIDVLRYRTGVKYQKDAIAALSCLLMDDQNKARAASQGIAPILLRLLVLGNPKKIDVDGILALMASLATSKEGCDELNKIDASPALSKLVKSGKLLKQQRDTAATISLSLNPKPQSKNLTSDLPSEKTVASNGNNYNSLTNGVGTKPDTDEGKLANGGGKKLETPRPDGPRKNSRGDVSSRRSSPVIPNEFRCPISLELMKDPVIVATGQTYERESIEKWLEGGKRTCPNTQRHLTHLNLKPNYVLSASIEEWCKKNGADIPGKPEPPATQGPNSGVNNKASSSPQSSARSIETENSSSADDEEKHSSSADHERVPVLVQILFLKASSEMERKAAAFELQNLAKNSRTVRESIVNAGAVPFLADLVSAEHDANTQEIAIQTILILSLNDDNKRSICDPSTGALRAIVHALKHGTKQAQESAAAALFSLSIVDENKVLIGASDAIPALVDVLSGRGSPTRNALKEAATGLLTLSIYQGNKARAVRAGVVPHLIKLLNDEHLHDLVLAILAVLSNHVEGRAAIERGKLLPDLVGIMRSGSDRNKESALTILSALIMKNPELIREAEKCGADEVVSEFCVNGPEKLKLKALTLLEFIENLDWSD